MKNFVNCFYTQRCKKVDFFYILQWIFSKCALNYVNEATLWCNGSTNDFGSFSRSSNLCGVAILVLKISCDKAKARSGK